MNHNVIDNYRSRKHMYHRSSQEFNNLQLLIAISLLGSTKSPVQIHPQVMKSLRFLGLRKSRGIL